MLPDVRKTLADDNTKVCRRAIEIVAWQRDANSLDILRALRVANGLDAARAAWAVARIDTLHAEQ